MPRLAFLPAAEADLREIARFIAADNPERARTFVGEIMSRCQLLAASPKIGRESDKEFGEGVRRFPLGRYIVFYRIVPDGIKVIRVLHSARNVPGM